MGSQSARDWGCAIDATAAVERTVMGRRRCCPPPPLLGPTLKPTARTIAKAAKLHKALHPEIRGVLARDVKRLRRQFGRSVALTLLLLNRT